MKIAIVGTGYVGLVTGTCLAETGLNVYCVDIDENKISLLNQGICPIYEPGLEPLIKNNIEKKRLFFTTNLKEAIDNANVVFISVGTPPDEDGSADLKHVLNVAREIGQKMEHYLLVVTKSTVPVGTAEKVRKTIQDELNKRNLKIDFDVASNPEFLKEGDAVNDFMKPDRIIIGVDNSRAEEIMRKLYAPFLLNNHPIYFMDIPSAELTKYAANAMLATRISFMNELSWLCEKTGADINNIRIGIGSDPRIGNKFLYAGVGYGGSCFPKDVKALMNTAKEYGLKMSIIEAVDNVNNVQKTILVEKVLKHYGIIENKVFSIWGLSFKPNTDDMREAPSLAIIDKLLERRAILKVYDPVAMSEAKKKLGERVIYSKNIYDSIENSEGILLVTEWHEFRNPDWDKIKTLMKEPVVFDGRNIYDRKFLKNKGFEYYAIGR